MHIKLSEAMYHLNMTEADLTEVIPDPFGNVFDDPDAEDDNDPRWPAYFEHMRCVQKWESKLLSKARNPLERDVILSEFARTCEGAGYTMNVHGSRVMSWFLTEIKNPDQEFVR